jgi:hypothetical protein
MGDDGATPIEPLRVFAEVYSPEESTTGAYTRSSTLS